MYIIPTANEHTRCIGIHLLVFVTVAVARIGMVMDDVK
jgi:hypothetical protein